MVGKAVARIGGGLGPITFEDARIVFRNFSGKEGQYNREGDRNFALILPYSKAAEMEEAGWNVKYLRPREDGDEPQPYLPVAVSYKARPPRVVTITSNGRHNIPEELVDMLDWVDIANVDLIVTPYAWGPINGKSGIKAYLKTIFITIAEDELELKYKDVPDSALSSLPVMDAISSSAADEDEIIYGELIEDD